MENQEKQYLYVVRIQKPGAFQPMVNQYDYIRETVSYYFVMEHGKEIKLHKSSTKLRCFFDLEETKIYLKKMRELAIEHLKEKIEKIEQSTTFRLNKVDPEPFIIPDDIRI